LGRLILRATGKILHKGDKGFLFINALEDIISLYLIEFYEMFPKDM